MADPIRILIADDHAVVRSGLRALLALQEDMEVVAEARDGLEAVEHAGRHRPDVVLLDLEMPRLDGVQAIPKILESSPSSRILVLTSFATDEKVFPSIKAGAVGYLLKDSSADDLVASIRQVHRGESALHPVIARKVLSELAAPAEGPLTADPLTPRELEVLRLIAIGLGNSQIAAELVLSETTVRNYVSNVLNKLHLANRTQAALYAIRKGLAPVGGSEEAPDSPE
jgi:NarL family two-component system response regulator LiaR